jgi:hypothetical protein
VEVPPRGEGWTTVLLQAREGTYKYSVEVRTEAGEVLAENDPYIDVTPPPPGPNGN